MVVARTTRRPAAHPRVRRVLRATALLGGLAAALPARAQTPVPGYSVAGWTTEQGLPSNVVLDVRQTPDGYLWLASYQGLIRFDGVSFRLFTRDAVPGLKGELFIASAVDRSGTLWTGTESSGLVRQSGGRFELFTMRQGLSSDKIGAVHAGASGRLWVGHRPGVTYLAGNRFVPLPLPAGVEEPLVSALAEDGAGGLWIGTVAGGLLHHRGSRVEHLGTGDGLGDDRITSLLRDRSGTLWVGGYGVGATRVRGDSITRVATGDSVAPRRVNEFLEDADGTIWLGADNGLFRLEACPACERGGERAVPVTRPDGRPFLQVEALRLDAEGSLWVGTRPNGLFRLRRASFGHLGRTEGLPHDLVYAVDGDGAGGQWIATLGGLLHRGADRHTLYSVRGGGLRDDVVRDVVRDAAGVVWAATNGGLTRIAAGRSQTYTMKDGLPDDRVRVLLPARDGGLWAGTMNGLAYVKDGRIRAFGPEVGLTDPYVLSLFEDRDGTVWVGTQTEGLFRREADDRFVRGAEGLAGQPVFRVHQSADGALWAGTARGLLRVAAGRVTRLTTRDGLPGDVVFYAIEDGLGYLWLAGPWGIARASLASLDDVAAGRRRTIDAKLFGSGDGMPVREASALSKAWRAPDGALWFPTPAGIARVVPGQLLTNRRPPPVHVERLVAGDDTVIAGGDDVRIPPGTRRLELHYTALGFVAPAGLRFRYRLDGYDDAWVENVGRRIAYFTNLPPGHYTFRVQARNEDGVWNEQGASLPFVILPHPWQTGWFRTLLVLVLAGLAVVLMRQHVRRHRIAVQAEERERTRAHVTGILESISDGFVALDADWRFTYVNRTAEQLLGVPRGDLLGRVCWDAVPDYVRRATEPTLRQVAAERTPRVLDAMIVEETDRWIEMHAFPAEPGISIYFADVTTRVHAEEALRGLSLRDDLTGLYNRRGLVALAEQQVRVADRTREGFEVMFVDLDGLKQINDALGHPIGDQALLDAAAILRATFRESDVLARLGGDEFAAIVVGDADTGLAASARLREVLARHNGTAGRPYELSLSVGHARFDPDAPMPIDELIRLADRRMYAEKRLKGAVRVMPA